VCVCVCACVCMEKTCQDGVEKFTHLARNSVCVCECVCVRVCVIVSVCVYVCVCVCVCVCLWRSYVKLEQKAFSILRGIMCVRVSERVRVCV